MLYEDAAEMVEYQGPRPSGRPPGRRTILLYAPARDPHLQKLTELANPGVLHLQRAGQGQEGRGEDAGSAEDSGGVLMRWPWRAASDRAQADGKQGHGAGDGQGDPGGGLPRPAWRGGGDDQEQAGGERAGGAPTCYA